jgi:hypothetical protein
MNLIDSSAPLCKSYSNAIASSSLIKHPPNGWISGCLYDNNGRIISLSQRFGGYYGDFYPNADPATIETNNLLDLPVLKGKSVYLGHFMPHYGHFLVEMLSSFWIYRSFSIFDYFVFHPFVFGEELPSYIKEAFQAFSIPLAKIQVIKTQTILTDVLIPERLIKLNKSAKTEAKRIYQFLTDTLVKVESLKANRCYYISRVRISLKSGERAVINEPCIEHALSRMGFLTIYPELLSFSKQVSLFHHADIICGLSGSALHNCVFMRPNSLLIEIADLRSLDATHPMQQVCNELSSVAYRLVPFSGHILHREKQLCVISLMPMTSEIEAIIKNHQVAEGLTSPSREATFSFHWLYTSAMMITKNILRLFKWQLMRDPLKW